MTVFFLIICLPLNIVFHELGHVFCFIIMKIEMKKICIGPLMFTKTDKWKLAYSKHNNKCYVVPKVKHNKNKEYYINSIRKSLIFGPAVSFFFLCLYLVYLGINHNLLLNNRIEMMLVLFNIAINVSILHGCFTYNKSSVGDIYLFIKSKNHECILDDYFYDLL